MHQKFLRASSTMLNYYNITVNISESRKMSPMMFSVVVFGNGNVTALVC